jgi:cell division protein ZapA
MHSVEVKILGQSYSIRTDEDEDYIRSIASYVDEKLKEIYSVAPNANQGKAAIMAAFGIADELFKLKMERKNGTR